MSDYEVMLSELRRKRRRNMGTPHGIWADKELKAIADYEVEQIAKSKKSEAQK